jgi:hypothetical protein
MARVARRSVPGALVLAALVMSACGGRVAPARGVGLGSPGTSVSSGAPSTSTTTAATATSTLPTLPATGQRSSTTTSVTLPAGSADDDATQRAILTSYETYLVDLSDLDDNLNQSDVAPLATVSTYRLAQASVRQAAAILAAHEHGVGTLRDDHVSVVVTGPTSAVIADCQDEYDFYLVEESGTPDPFVARADFTGSAQMVLEKGTWLVDVFTTTHETCAF